ncbi:MAG: T9SS type A sorting domain-containing protein, partial [Candidatus Eisenbacteria bacterium]|nr:T9SS type A sorting domain-containing protein [Candidatus Eisenbacteria bacterium]
AGGRDGLLTKTTDGGETWVAQGLGIIEDVRDFEFLDADLGWLVGGGGMVLKTTDGGENWVPQGSDSTSYLQSVSFVDPDHGWATGGSGEETVVMKTTDGGETWQVGPPPEPTVGLNTVAFASEDIGWLGGYEASIYKTTDGGDSWVEQFNDSGTSYTSVSCLQALNQNTVWGVGYVGVEGRSMKTADGGEEWGELLGSGNEALHSVFFLDQTNGWAVGHIGTILVASTNGGLDPGGSSGVDDESPQPGAGDLTVRLLQNRPNPFRSGTTISYVLPRATRVDLRVFNVAGRQVRVLRSSVEQPGAHQVAWDGRNNRGEAVPAGVYFSRLDTSSRSATIRMLLVR